MENENNPIKIIVEDNGKKLELETLWDSDIDDWEKVFRVILKWLTFGDSLVNEFFGRDDVGEDLPKEDNKN